MPGRLWSLAMGVGGVLAACGGTEFEQGEDGAGAMGGGGSSNAGTAGTAGAPPTGGAGAPAGGEGGSASGGAPAAPPSIEIVQTSVTDLSGNVDPSITLSELPSAGNALIVGISCFSDFENCRIPEGGVTDDQGNDYALVIEGDSIVSSDTHGTRPYLFIAENIGEPSGPLTITINPNGTPTDNYQNFAWGVLEVAGLVLDSVDQTDSLPTACCASSTTVSTDDATRQSNELAVAVHSARSNDDDFNYGHDSDWTEHHVNDDGLSLASQHSLVTRILSEPAVVSHTWTHDEPTRGVAAIIATFRGAAP